MTDRRPWAAGTAPYYATAAYRSAIAHPFHVSAWLDWRADPVTVGFGTEAEARGFATSRPEPIIDLVRRDHGVIAWRRMLAHPSTTTYLTGWSDDPGPHDDF